MPTDQQVSARAILAALAEYERQGSTRAMQTLEQLEPDLVTATLIERTSMTAATASDRISLYYHAGSSDKVYQASIEPSGSGFLVNFAYGRRGSTLQTGTKTASPVSHEKARGIFDKLVGEKMAKGYTPGPDGTPYAGTQREARNTGIVPQLLNPIEEDHANRLVEDPDWVAQEKFDGRRVTMTAVSASRANTTSAVTVSVPADPATPIPAAAAWKSATPAAISPARSV